MLYFYDRIVIKSQVRLHFFTVANRSLPLIPSLLVKATDISPSARGPFPGEAEKDRD